MVELVSKAPVVMKNKLCVMMDYVFIIGKLEMGPKTAQKMKNLILSKAIIFVNHTTREIMAFSLVKVQRKMI